MKALYFVRHGQTVWNLEQRLCGRTDVKLSKLGHDQAVALGKLIRQNKLRIDQILYSPLVRAADTARYIADYTGIPMKPEPRLTEQDYGCFESGRRYAEEFLAAEKQFAVPVGGGESMLRLCQRVYNLLDEIKEEPGERVYLLVSHLGVSRAIHSYFHEMTNEELAGYGAENCELIQHHYPDVEKDSFLT